MKTQIIVIGGGGHAKVIISIIKKIDRFEIVGFTDNEIKNSILGVPYLGDDSNLTKYYDKAINQCVIGIGQIKTANIRKKVVDRLSEIGFNFPSIVSPNAVINEDVIIGKGTVVMDGAIINSGTHIGSFSIVNTKASVDHDCRIGDFVHIAPGSTLSGNVKIENEVLIGTGASVIQDINISSNIIIASGSSVQKDITESGIYKGVPANKVY